MMKYSNVSLLASIALVSVSSFAGSSEVSEVIQQQRNVIEKTIKELSQEQRISLIPYQEGNELSFSEPVLGSPNGAINLQQGWTQSSQQEFYYTSQGSQILPYRWYLYLEQASADTLFRNQENIEKYGYLPSDASKRNPDRLSVGFVKDVDSQGNEWMGFTCAACHTTEVTYKDMRMRIDGGPTLADFQAFNVDLVAALQATLASDSKFERFASKVLDEAQPSADSKQELKQALQSQTAVLNHRNTINVTDAHQVPYGYGRLDAIGAIFNQVLSVFTDDPRNARAATAPVSYPFLWGTHQSDYVQWTGFAPNGPLSIGALIRNGGEVLGVYGKIDINPSGHGIGYSNSIDFRGLGLLEARVAQLRSPKWPVESNLKAFQIDTDKANKGKALYKQECASCHTVVAREDEGQNYKAVMTPLSELQTDSQEILNMVSLRNADQFSGRKEAIIAGPTIGYTTQGLDPLVNSVVGSAVNKLDEAALAAFVQYMGGKLAAQPNNGINVPLNVRLKEDAEAFASLTFAYNELIKLYDKCNLYKASESKCVEAFNLLVKLLEAKTLAKDIDRQIDEFFKNPEQQSVNTEIATGQVYKARPLNGIWATAPYLHNGSVLSLMELLQPSEERLKSFYVGSRELDPVNVGLINKQTPNSTLLDTTLLGNSNWGHDYGTQLTEAEKQALVEYMKTL